MKKYLFIAAAALVAMAACNKAPKAVEPESELPSQSGPAWLYDQSKPVPILFGGQDVTTKASGMIVNENTDPNNPTGNFIDIEFGVLGVDLGRLSNDSEDLDVILLPGVVGKNYKLEAEDVDADGAYPGATEGTTVVTFPEADNQSFYYPMFSKNDAGVTKKYTFFAYRTENEPEEGHADMAYTRTGVTFTKPVEFGATDILWANAVAQPLTSGTEGFNAAYVREAMEAGTFYTTYAPKFEFQHLTAAFKFVVKAATPRAERTLDGNLSVTGITVKGLATSATLNINAGTFGGPDPDIADDNAVLEVPYVAEEENPFYPKYNDNKGIQFGSPLFTLPSADYTAAGINNYAPKAIVALALPNNENLEVELNITAPNNGFEKGKAYQFNVIINSLEEIQIVTTLTDWDETPAAIDLDPIG